MAERVIQMDVTRYWRPFICLFTLTLLAACATTQQTPQSSALVAPYTLAILPWNLTKHRQADIYGFGMAALKKTLKTVPFRPVSSYYPFSNTTRLASADIAGIEELWNGGFFASGPPSGRALEMGRQLGVDAVLVYAIHAKPGPDDMWAHLFDIPQNQHYIAE